MSSAKSNVYGYCRISTSKQNIKRQELNIISKYPSAVIITEVGTGTKTEGRPKWQALYKRVAEGDTIVFDEVSRMSRNANEGFNIYQELFKRGVTLVFLKEPHINTELYKKAITKQIKTESVKTGSKATDTLIDGIFNALNAYTLELAKEQIHIAFEKAQSEVDYLHKRTSEGIERARMDGKQIGRKSGAKIVTKKELEKKAEIKKYSRDFEGSLSDIDCMKITGLSRNTYYKYKALLRA